MAYCALDDGVVLQTCASRTSLTAGDFSAGTAAPHVDDCFCCSRCVEGSAYAFAATLTPLAVVAVDAADLPLSVVRRLYHPPLTLA